MNVLSHGVLSRLKTLQQADPAQGMSAKRYFFSIKEASGLACERGGGWVESVER